MSEIQRKIEILVAPILEAKNTFLIDVQLGFSEKRRNIQLFIDSDTGVTIDTCAEISRQLGAALEVSPIMDEPYVLEVSSPGSERPLKLLRQYAKHVGRRLRIRYTDGSEVKNVTGKLEKIDSDRLFINDTKNVSEILFSNIIESRVELPW